MTILELATKIQDAGVERERQRNAAQQEGFWIGKRQELTESAKRIDAPVRFLQWDSGVEGVPAGLPGVDELKKAIAALKGVEQAFVDDPAKLVNTPTFSDAIRRVDTLVRRLEELAAERWATVARNTVWDRADLWAPYRGSDEHGDVIEVAIRQDALFDRLVDLDYLASQSDRELFTSLRNERRELLKELPPAPAEDVRVFIQEAQVGVPLSKLDARVFKWLEDQGLLDSYIVKYHR